MRIGESDQASIVKPFSFLADAFDVTTARELGERARMAGGRAESFRCVHCRLDVPLAAAGTAHRRPNASPIR